MLNKNLFLVLAIAVFLALPQDKKPVVIPIGILGWLFLAYFDMAGPKEYELLRSLIKSKAFVASKSYCPYCKSAIEYLKKNNIEPKVIQLDQMINGTKLQSGLEKITDGHKTVPYVFIGGKFIGGNDSLQHMGIENILKLLSSEKTKNAKAQATKQS